MGANSQQGWALFLFLIGFTFLPAGLVYLGPIFAILGIVSLVVSAVWFVRIRPLEFGEEDRDEAVKPSAAKSKRAI
jgi:hypothetical protein